MTSSEVRTAPEIAEMDFWIAVRFLPVGCGGSLSGLTCVPGMAVAILFLYRVYRPLWFVVAEIFDNLRRLGSKDFEFSVKSSACMKPNPASLEIPSQGTLQKRLRS